MGIALKNKKVTPPTAQERSINASLDVQNALSAFTDALTTMDEAATQLLIAEEEAYAESRKHRDIGWAAYDERVKTEAVAAKFRALLEV